jgi:hypothetical protein
MSDDALTPDEIAQLLLKTINAEGSTESKPSVTQDEMNRLLTALLPAYNAKLNHTEPLTQDEINQLLAMLDNDKT